MYFTILCSAALLPLVAAQTPDLRSLLSSTPELSTLRNVIGPVPDLLDLLDQASNITVLAPSNTAFETLYQSERINELEDPIRLASLLQYHILDAPLRISNLTNSPQFFATILSSQLYSNVTDGQVVAASSENNQTIIVSGNQAPARVVQSGIEFSGGIVHIIDNVLTLPGSLSEAAERLGLSSFLNSLNDANLTAVVGSLNDITIFAPTNDAFQNVGNLTQQQLVTTLGRHVVDGIVYSDRLDEADLKTLNGIQLDVRESETGAAQVNGATITTQNILLSNGVLHVVDSILASSNSTSGGVQTSASALPSGTVTQTATSSATESEPTETDRNDQTGEQGGNEPVDQSEEGAASRHTLSHWALVGAFIVFGLAF